MHPWEQTASESPGERDRQARQRSRCDSGPIPLPSASPRHSHCPSVHLPLRQPHLDHRHFPGAWPSPQQRSPLENHHAPLMPAPLRTPELPPVGCHPRRMGLPQVQFSPWLSANIPEEFIPAPLRRHNGTLAFSSRAGSMLKEARGTFLCSTARWSDHPRPTHNRTQWA